MNYYVTLNGAVRYDYARAHPLANAVRPDSLLVPDDITVNDGDTSFGGINLTAAVCARL